MDVCIHGLDLLAEVGRHLGATDLEGRGHHPVLDREGVRGQVHTLHKLKAAQPACLAGLIELLQERCTDLGVVAKFGQSNVVAQPNLRASDGVCKGQEGLRLGDHDRHEGALQRVAVHVDLLD